MSALLWALAFPLFAGFEEEVEKEEEEGVEWSRHVPRHGRD